MLEQGYDQLYSMHRQLMLLLVWGANRGFLQRSRKQSCNRTYNLAQENAALTLDIDDQGGQFEQQNGAFEHCQSTFDKLLLLLLLMLLTCTEVQDKLVTVAIELNHLSFCCWPGVCEELEPLSKPSTLGTFRQTNFL